MIDYNKTPLLYVYNTLHDVPIKILQGPEHSYFKFNVEKVIRVHGNLKQIISNFQRSDKDLSAYVKKLKILESDLSSFIQTKNWDFLTDYRKHKDEEIKPIIPCEEHDEQFEKAKIDAKSCSTFSYDISSYGIQDQNKLSELAKIAITHHPIDLCHHISNYGIKDEEKLVELAIIAAAGKEYGISPFIDKFGIQNQDKLAQIALIAADNPYTPEKIQNYGIKDENILFEIAKKCSSKWPGETSKYIDQFGFTDEKKLFEVAMISVGKDADYTCGHIGQYKIKDEEKLFEIAKVAASGKEDFGISQYVENYKFKDKGKLLALAKLAVHQNSRQLSKNIHKYEITNKKELFELAKIAADEDGKHTSTYISNYELTPSMLYKVAKIAVANNGYTSFYYYGGDETFLRIYCLQKNSKETFKLAKIALSNILGNLEGEQIDVLATDDRRLPKTILGHPLKELIPKEAALALKLIQNPNHQLRSKEKDELGYLGTFTNLQSTHGSKRMERQRSLINTWIGYYLLKYHLSVNSKVKLNNPANSLSFKSKNNISHVLDFNPLLKAISKLRNPAMRYKLHQLLFSQLYNSKTKDTLEIYRQLNSDSNKKMPNEKEFTPEFGTTDRVIYRLLLTPLIYSENKDKDFTGCSPLFKNWEIVLSTLSEKPFKNAIIQMPVVTSLYALIKAFPQKELNLNSISRSYLSGEDKGQLVRAIFALGTKFKSDSSKKALVITQNLSLMEAIIIADGSNVLKKLVSEIKDFQFPAEDSLQKALEKVFFDVIGEVEIKDFTEKYERTFHKGRHPMAFISYASKLKNLQSHEENAIKPYLRKFYEDLLEGNFQKNRYETVEGDHLNTVFSWKKENHEREAWKKVWMTGESRSLQIEIDDKLAFSNGTDVNKYFYQKVSVDKHIDPKDFEVLNKFLFTDASFRECEENIQLLDQMLKEKENQNEVKKHTILLQKEVINLCDSRQTSVEKEASINAATEYMHKIYPDKDDHPFIQDLLDLGKLMNAKQKKESYTGWSVVDTDHWEDLLLCGTEVLGSCQNIYGSSEYNKHLMNYLLDGKIRLVAIKNEEGHIKARAIIRLMWDPVLKQPVLFRERFYSAAGIAVDLFDEIDAMCLSRAKLLGIALVRLRETDTGNYPNDLVSMNSRTPFEYVDACRGPTNGTFAVPSEIIEII